MFRERRIIGRTLKPGQLPVNSRRAEDLVALQNADSATKGVRLGSNPNADIVEKLVDTNIRPDNVDALKRLEEGSRLADASLYVQAPGTNAQVVQRGMEGNLVDEFGQPTAAGRENQRNVIASTEKGVTYDPKTGLTTLASPAENLADAIEMRKQQRLQGISREDQIKSAVKIVGKDAKGGNITRPDYAEQAEIRAAHLKEEIAKREAERQAKGISGDGAQSSTKPPASPTLPTSQEQSQGSETNIFQGLFDYAQQNPEFASTFLPEILQLQRMRTQAEMSATGALDALDETDRDKDGVTDAVGDAVEESKEMLQKEKDESDRIAANEYQRQLDAAELAKDMAKIEKDRFELRQVQRENEIRDQNIDTEMKNRRISAKLGITADSNGLQWMQKEIRKGNEALTNLQLDGDLMRQGYALTIGKQYQNDVRAAINHYDDVRHSVGVQYRKDLAELDDAVSLDAKERRKERIGIEEKKQERLFQADLETVRTLKSARESIMARQTEMMKESQKDVIKTGDSLKFVQDLRGRVLQDQVVKDSTDISTAFSAMESSWKYYNSLPVEERNRVATDQAIITTFAKMLDPGSVVRESEYARTPENTATMNRLWGAYQRLVSGGAGVTPEDLASMVDTAREVKKSYDKLVMQRIEPFISDIALFNSQPQVQRPVKLQDVLPSNLIPTLPSTTTDRWKSIITGGSSVGAFSFTQSSGEGWRTDRHNNPIAFSVQAGGKNDFTKALERNGIGWEYGDPFPDNPSQVTVKVLGNPIEASRVVLSETNAIQNWYKNHSGRSILPKYGVNNNSDFAKLSTQEQNDIIAGIYKSEVGDGSLLAYAGTSSSPIIPTAHAADYTEDDIDIKIEPDNAQNPEPKIILDPNEIRFVSEKMREEERKSRLASGEGVTWGNIVSGVKNWATMDGKLTMRGDVRRENTVDRYTPKNRPSPIKK